MSGFSRLAPWPLYYRQSRSVFIWPIQASALQWRCFLWEVSGICLVWHWGMSSAIGSTNAHVLERSVGRGLSFPNFGGWGGEEMQRFLGLLLPGCPGRGVWCCLVLHSGLWENAFEVLPHHCFGQRFCKGCSMLVISAAQTPHRHWRILAIPQPGWGREWINSSCDGN